MDVTEVRGEMREKALHVLSLAIPGNQTRDRECVPEIVQPWLKTPSIESENSSFCS